jgi:hypothetical protein
MLAHEENVCHGALDDLVSNCSTVDAKILDDSRSDCSEAQEDINTLIIFDWDDTLFPTSWLRMKNLFEDDAALSDTNKALLQRLADAAELALKAASQLGKVVIVTNAQKGWVEMCSAKLLPSLVHTLNDVDIVSARSGYEQESENPAEWKRRAFLDQVQLVHRSSKEHLNLISVGDSLHEHGALVSACASVGNSSGKSIKFREGPGIEHLIDELRSVGDIILDVAEYNGDLDVEVDMEVDTDGSP